MAIKKLGYNIYAVDLEPNGCLEELSEITVKKCDLDKDNIPFENKMFDAIISARAKMITLGCIVWC
jgi:hypothetical protein